MTLGRDAVRAAIVAAVLLASASVGAQSRTPAKGGDGKTGSQAAGQGAKPSPYAARYAETCAACHGADGRSEMPGTPTLAGQHAFYSITQLFMFREGRRSNELMSAVAKGMKDDDMRGFADFIASLPPVAPPRPESPPDGDRMKRGQQLAQQHKCAFCHGADFSGGQQVPRVADQREEYLTLVLREFKAGKRPGYSMAMAEAVGPVTVEELDTIAYYLARVSAAEGGTGRAAK